jgi:hypothetical protein
MVKTDSMLAAKDVAEYFVHLVDQESGDNITNLKLQEKRGQEPKDTIGS